MDQPTEASTNGLAEIVRSRREELRLSRKELVAQIVATPGNKKVSESTIKKMERKGQLGYRLSARKWGKGPSALELVADALGVPLGYFLAAFPREQIMVSQYGQAVRAGQIQLVSVLRDDVNPESLLAFLDKLPETELELFELPLHSYKNQLAFAVIFRIERLYSGLEMLIVNEPPLIFWDSEDIDLWIENMGLSPNDRITFRREFDNYRTYFRKLVQEGKKRYKVVINIPTLQRFLNRKSPASRRSMIADLCAFVKRPTFDLALHNPIADFSTRTMSTAESIEAHECEVLCKMQTIPASLEGTVSIQIMQTPPHLKPVGYFVSPAPRDMVLVQREIGRIQLSWAAALDQYRQALGGRVSPVSQLRDELVREHTISLLKAI